MRPGSVAMAVAILMPVYNEALRLGRTVLRLRDVAARMGHLTVFVVDDGSDAPVDALPEPTSTFSLVLARHPVNLGQGAALETARQLALAGGSVDAYVPMDADGQHNAEDAVAIARAIEAGADVAFGDRFLGESNVPWMRARLLGAARVFERGLTGLALHDAHNGLRGFSRAALEQVTIRQNRMAHATEIKQCVSRARGLSVVEVPVSVRYSRETLAKGQHGVGAARIVGDLLAYYLFGEAE